jgi:hypothetical protein
MLDNGPMPWDLDRGRQNDRYVHVDAGIDSARILRAIALVSIASRLFYIYASATRISFTHAVLGTLGADGKINLTDWPGGAAGLVSQAHNADSLVTFAVVASIVMILLLVVALASLSRRRKRGDAVAIAVHENRGVRLAGRLYVLVAVVAIIGTNLLKPSPDAPPVDRLHMLLVGDNITIGLQLAVIAILLLIVLGTGREIAKARAAARIG